MRFPATLAILFITVAAALPNSIPRELLKRVDCCCNESSCSGDPCCANGCPGQDVNYTC